jgi:para-nitrobenzyl esterase
LLGYRNRQVEHETIVANPYEVFEAAKFNDTPILVETNSNEGGLFVTQKTEKMVHSQYAAGAEAILKAYPHATEAEAPRSAGDLMREFIFAWPTWACAKMQSLKSLVKSC